MKDPSTLTPQQEQAIPALLESRTLSAAAGKMGVSEVTLWRWLQEPAFQEAYRQARCELVNHAIGRLQQASGEAVDTLRAVMTDSEAPASARVTAARSILEAAVNAVELEDLDRRLAELETRLGKETPPHAI